MLVLLDCSTSSCSLGAANRVVPVIRLPEAHNDGDLSAMGEAYYTQENIQTLQRDFLGSFNEMANHSSTSVTVGTALSIASELSHTQNTGLIAPVTDAGYIDRGNSSRSMVPRWFQRGTTELPVPEQFSTSP